MQCQTQGQEYGGTWFWLCSSARLPHHCGDGRWVPSATDSQSTMGIEKRSACLLDKNEFQLRPLSLHQKNTYQQVTEFWGSMVQSLTITLTVQLWSACFSKMKCWSVGVPISFFKTLAMIEVRGNDIHPCFVRVISEVAAVCLLFLFLFVGVVVNVHFVLISNKSRVKREGLVLSRRRGRSGQWGSVYIFNVHLLDI
ncbi:hypothetical protein B0H19DRAFT_229469 [Mycena capillaripes]|nr:hypothetical protein B0H19DRAFT_229469 [Mycena capillaripes]